MVYQPPAKCGIFLGVCHSRLILQLIRDFSFKMTITLNISFRGGNLNLEGILCHGCSFPFLFIETKIGNVAYRETSKSGAVRMLQPQYNVLLKPL